MTAERPDTGFVPDRILVHFPEITLKGRNREDFEHQLAGNLRHRLKRAGARWPLRRARGRFYVEVPPEGAEALERIVDVCASTMGVATAAPAAWLRPGEACGPGGAPERELIESTMVAMARAVYQPGATFAVRVNRVEKGFPMVSQEMERWLGGAIRAHTDWDRVALKHPDCTFRVDVYPDGLYLYADRRRGPGGLPVHSSGRVLALLSGGIDSPVAAWLMAKRGCGVDFFHMSASHPRPDALEDEVVTRLARELSRYTLQSRLYVAPYTHFDLALAGEHSGYELMLFRRFFTRTAAALAARLGTPALVSGDSLGQVASQTIENLVANARATDVPVFQPLIGYNKQEIVELARRIGTYEISIQPSKDCCALLSRRPRTRSSDETLAQMEQRLFPDYAGLVERTLEDMVELSFDCGERVHPRPAASEAGASS